MAEIERDPREQYANWKASGTSAEAGDDARVDRIITEREKQTFSSRLSEYITGMKPEDPRMLERLETDQQIVRAKYDLPALDLSPSEFERALRQKARKLGTRIKSESECGKFFDENPMVGAVQFAKGEGGGIGINIEQTTREDYVRSLNKLEHELVHAEQDKHSPSMPIELMEYEAYVAEANIDYLKKHPEAVDEVFFNFFVGGSVDFYYNNESKKRGEKVTPHWNNPEYFLKLDGIDPGKLKKSSHV